VPNSIRLLVFTLLAATVAVTATSLEARPGGQNTGRPPAVGEKAPDFTLRALDGMAVTLSAELQRGPVVLVLLRGWPGYHCPFCVRQFGEFLGRRQDLEATGARVVWIYPAASANDIHAEAFVANQDVPTFFRLLVDPGFVFTNRYGLRWDAPNETSYPATFVIDRAGVVRFAEISRIHGGRTAVDSVLAALRGLDRR
jgi:thioredoxin-dependent peroxiredoxin